MLVNQGMNGSAKNTFVYTGQKSNVVCNCVRREDSNRQIALVGDWGPMENKTRKRHSRL